MDKVYSYLCYGMAGMYIGLLVIEWVMLESKFIKEYYKTNFKIRLVTFPIMIVLILLMYATTKDILPFIIISCTISYDNHLTKEMLYSENKDSINDRKE